MLAPRLSKYNYGGIRRKQGEKLHRGGFRADKLSGVRSLAGQLLLRGRRGRLRYWLRLCRLGLHALQYGARAGVPGGIDGQRDGGDHESHG